MGPPRRPSNRGGTLRVRGPKERGPIHPKKEVEDHTRKGKKARPEVQNARSLVGGGRSNGSKDV